jgi:hypothetical protein
MNRTEIYNKTQEMLTASKEAQSRKDIAVNIFNEIAFKYQGINMPFDICNEAIEALKQIKKEDIILTDLKIEGIKIRKAVSTTTDN